MVFVLSNGSMHTTAVDHAANVVYAQHKDLCGVIGFHDEGGLSDIQIL